MNSNNRGLFVLGALALALTLGYAIGGHAQAKAARVEHHCITATSSLTEAANNLGKDGWTMVSAQGYTGVEPGQSVGLHRQLFLMCFKR